MSYAGGYEEEAQWTSWRGMGRRDSCGGIGRVEEDHTRRAIERKGQGDNWEGARMVRKGPNDEDYRSSETAGGVQGGCV